MEANVLGSVALAEETTMTVNQTPNKHRPDYSYDRLQRTLFRIKYYPALCVLVYGISAQLRNLEEMIRERSIEIDRSNIYRWVQKLTPKLEVSIRKGEKYPAGKRVGEWTRCTSRSRSRASGSAFTAPSTRTAPILQPSRHSRRKPVKRESARSST